MSLHRPDAGELCQSRIPQSRDGCQYFKYELCRAVVVNISQKYLNSD